MAEVPFALEELLEQGYRKLAQDRARMGGLNYPAYKGETLAPMSDLTQRARGLREYYAGKPTPYSNKISSALSRPTGLSDNSISGLLDNIGGRQRDYGDSLLGKLRNEFRSSYDNRVDRFQRKSGRDIGRGVGEFRGKLGDIKTLSSNLDQNANIATAKALQGLSGQKQARRNLLIDNLEQFGKQKQGLTNLQLKADKAAFDAEVQAPFEKANRLEEVLNRGNNAVRGELHPDLEKPMVDQINQAMTAYNAPNQKYQGEMIAGSNPELDTSQELMGRLSPKFRDSFYPERKELTGRLSNAERSVSESALDNVPEAIRGQIEQLEYAGGKRLKSDLGRLSNKYTRLGQYGSPQHMKEAEERARGINESILEQRNKLTEGNLKNQLQMQHQSNIGDIKKLGMLGDQGQQEFGDSIKNIRDLNRLGSTKWKNQQAENEELYKNYMNEAMWMWPHMRGQAMQSGRSGAFSDVFNNMRNNNISLENLANLNTNYQEMERERDNYRTQVGDQANQYQGQLNNLQSIIDTQKRELALRNQRQAEQARLAREGQQAAERERQRQENARREQERLNILQAQGLRERYLSNIGTNMGVAQAQPQDAWWRDRVNEYLTEQKYIQNNPNLTSEQLKTRAYNLDIQQLNNNIQVAQANNMPSLQGYQQRLNYLKGINPNAYPLKRGGHVTIAN